MNIKYLADYGFCKLISGSVVLGWETLGVWVFTINVNRIDRKYE